MLAALVMILAYCFLWFNAEKMMPACCGFVLSVLFSVQGRLQSGWQRRGQLFGYTGVFFSCRDEGRGLICDSTLPFSPFSVYIFLGFISVSVLWFALFLGSVSGLILPFLTLCFFGFIPPFWCASSLFYRDPAPNQSCLCRTVIFHERDRGREPWSTIGSNPLQIFSLLNRDGEDEHGYSSSNDDVLATLYS